MSFGKLGFSEPEQHTGPVYFDENGEGVTDLAFRTSLPFMHQGKVLLFIVYRPIIAYLLLRVSCDKIIMLRL